MEKIFIGYTRFSLVSQESKAWLISQKEDYLKVLFNEKRLNNRLFFIEKSMLSLSISGSSYKKQHFIFYSNLLPERFKEKLFLICKQFDFVIPVEVQSNSEFDFIGHISKWLSMNNRKQSLVGLYNLDDDDFLSKDYFSYSEKYLQECFLNFHISYGLGIKSYFYRSNFSGAIENYLPKINIGILTICQYKEGKIHWPGGGSHPTLDKRVPVILDSREHLYFWTRHHHQDTNSVKKRNYEDTITSFNKIDENILKEKFPIIYRTHKKLMKISALQQDNTGSFIFNNKGLSRLRIYYDSTHSIEDINKLKPLISFQFTNIDLILINKMEIKEIGLMKSLNEDYGFYRYLKGTNGKKHIDIDINIPKEISEIKLKVFTRGALFTALSIDVFQLVI